LIIIETDERVLLDLNNFVVKTAKDLIRMIEKRVFGWMRL
jgi:hypothetical protein